MRPGETADAEHGQSMRRELSWDHGEEISAAGLTGEIEAEGDCGVESASQT